VISKCFNSIILIILIRSDYLSSLTMFSENDDDFLESLPFNVHVQTFMQVQKEKKETKIRKIIKVKRQK